MYYKNVGRNIAHGSHYHGTCNLAVQTEKKFYIYLSIYIPLSIERHIDIDIYRERVRSLMWENLTSAE